jgi:CRISPR-associated protein Cas1
MKKLLNTLYVMTQGAYLSKEGETVEVSVERETRLRAPIHTLNGIVCLGQVTCSAPLMGFCAERNVSVSFMSEHGKFLARVQGPVSGNVLLRREQYRKADREDDSSEIARLIVAAKVSNSRTVLLRTAREHPDDAGSETLESAAGRLQRILEDLRNPMPLTRVRGCEGEAANVYFGVFDHLITAQKEDFFFRERSRRPPLDSMNALLSFLYVLLAHDAASALEGVGLDPAVGFLHRDRPGRPSLALDIMEEFRACFADRLALSLINRQQVRGKEFRKTETGAVLMDENARKTVLVAYQKRKQEEIRHPFLDETIPVGLLLHAQALLMARFIRGDLDAYPPFFWK